MTMTVKSSKRKENTVSLEIEAAPETIKTSMDKVFKDVVKTVSLPGFRKGKIPRHIFEKNFGTDMLIQDAVSDAVNVSYIKAIQELDLHVVDYPKNVDIGEYKENQPVKFTCEVDVKPEVKVSKYKGIKVEKESDAIDESLIENQIKQLQNSAAEYQVTEGAEAKEEDLLKVNVQATIDGESFDRWTKENVGVCIGSSIFSEDFDKELVGKKTDTEYSFTVTYKDDYYLKEVAGKAVDFRVTITEIKTKELPELTDELVAKLSEFKTVDELKTKARESLQAKRTEEVEEKLKLDILNQLLDANKFDVPEGLLNYEVNLDKQYYENTLAQSGSNLAKYLELTKQSEEEFLDQLKTNCLTRVKQDLIIEGVQRQEKLEVTEEDMKAEIQRLRPELDSDEKVAEELKKINLDGFETMLTRKKVLDFLIEHAKIKEKK